MSWFRKPGSDGKGSGPNAETFADLRREVADLASQLRIARRDLDDLDERFGRWRSRDAKRVARDAAEQADDVAQRALPTIGQFKASGRRFPGG
jgi:hypothetical protein